MRLLFSFFLIVSVFYSAVQVVFYEHEARHSFVELQELEKVRDGLNEEWGKLQLEQSTWATADRIERLARTKLNMVNPDIDSIVLLAEKND